jgi:hypothetical protein
MAIQQAIVYGRKIFDAVFDAVTATFHVLNHTPVVVIFKENGAIQSRCLVYSIPHVKLWGLDHRCIRPSCDKPGNIRSKTSRGPNHQYGKFDCISCGWTSKWIERPSWLHTTSKDFYFWFNYPLTAVQADYLIAQSPLHDVDDVDM